MVKWIKSIFGDISKNTEKSSLSEAITSIPTVKFDTKLATNIVKDDLWSAVLEIADFSRDDRAALYPIAVESVTRGGDLHLLTSAIQARNIEGVTIRRAGDIARFLNSRATSTISRERQIALGIEYAQWRYSGAPCGGADGMDRAHKAANGKKFRVKTGLKLAGHYTWPGREMGCKCFAKPIIKGSS